MLLPRPQVIAHRGASTEAPEHTRAAYQRAIDCGADALECDVRLTRDGVLVCLHDRRLDRTSSGRGPVSTRELAMLADLDFGDELGAGVLTFEELLQMVLAADRFVWLAVETKHPTRYAAAVERRVVELLARYGLDRPRPDGRAPVVVMSFATVSLRRFRALRPALPTVQLMLRVPLLLRDGRLPACADIGGPSLRALAADPGYVARLRSCGHDAFVWTVNDPADVAMVRALDVAAVITDRPREVLAQLGR